MGWYVGEPSEYAKTKDGKSRSYYSNPTGWKEKQQRILDFVKKVYEIYPKFYENASATPWVVMAQAITPEGEPRNYFKFDLWEDDEPLEDQKIKFMSWAEALA